MFLSTLFRRLERLPRKDAVLREALRQLQDWLGAESAQLRSQGFPRLSRAEIHLGRDQRSWYCQLRVSEFLLEFRHPQEPVLSAADQEGLEKFAKLLQELLENPELSPELFSLEEEVQDLIDTSLHFLATLSPDGELNHSNQRQVNLDFDRPIWEAQWLAEESGPAVRRAVALARDQKATQAVMIKTSRGSSYELSFTPLQNSQGEVSCLITRGRDTSDRERMRDVLLEEREFLRAVLESMDEAVVVCDRQARVTLVNEAAMRRFDLQLGDAVLDKIVFRGETSAELPLEETPFGRVLVGEQLRDAKCSCTDIDGDLRMMTASGCELLDTDGKPYGVVITLNDATQQLRAERALVNSERQLRALFNFQPNAILSLSPDGAVVRCNPAVESLLSQSPLELIGTPVSSLVVEPLVEIHFPGERELSFRRADGDLAWGMVTTVWVSDSEGDLGVMWTVRDISDQKRAELALDVSNRRLATSREMERMRLARELHDGAVQNLLAVSYRLPDRELREEVVDVVRQLRALISDLRPPGLKEFGLAAALEGLVAKMARQNQGEGPAVELVCLGCDSFPEAVSLCLFRLVQESVGNAMKHAEAQTIKVDVKCRSGEVVLQIRDDGKGFSVPENLSGYTGDERYGLAGMRERVELLNGVLTIVSGPGQGTSVQVTLPL